MTTNSKIKLNLDSLKARKEWKRHKVKDGHNIFRILPPFGEASNGYPYRKWQITWGLVDPESGRARPFASSMTSEKRCPITDFSYALKDHAETMKSQLKASGASEDDIKVRLKDLQDLISNISPKTVYIYNATDKSGEVGLLELKSTAHKDMKEKMTQYIHDYNQDPTSLNSADDDSGLWFDIIRQGTYYDTTYKVEKCQTKVKNGHAVSFMDDRSPLPESVVTNYDNLAYDLTAVYQTKTYDELDAILRANLPSIIEACPDADLSKQVSLSGTAVPGIAITKKAAGKVNLSLDGVDEEDTSDVKPAKLAKTAVVVDDDFMKDADAILNS